MSLLSIGAGRPYGQPHLKREAQGIRRTEHPVALFFRLFSFGQAKEIGSWPLPLHKRFQQDQ